LPIEDPPPPLAELPEVQQPASLTHSSTQENQQAISDATISQAEPPLVEEPPELPAVETSAVSTVSEPAPFVPITPFAEAPPAPPPPPAPRRPSIFGFQFDGDSFLGGMPLRLPKASDPAKPAAPARPAGNAPLTFTPYVSPRKTIVVPIPAPSDEMMVTEPPTAGPPAAEPPPPSPPPVAAQPTAAPPAAGPPIADAPVTPPPRPATPPPPARSPGAFPRPKRLAESMTVPPLAQPSTTTPPPRRQLSTAFDGLANRSIVGGLVGGPIQSTTSDFGFPAAARKPANRADVFSQVAAPISVEVFGAVQGNANEFDIPEIRKPLMPPPPAQSPPIPVPPPSSSGNGQPPSIDEELPDGAIPTKPFSDLMDSSDPPPPIAMPADADVPLAPAAPAPPARPSRRMRVPVLLTLMILLLAAVWAGVYYFLSPASRVTGTLAFSNVAPQPMSVQNVFQLQQVSRLGSEEVRSVARSMLAAQNQDAGFLNDAVQFEQATTKAGNIEFVDNGETLQLTTRVSDAALGKAQVAALLRSLKQKDADLVDAQARAQQADADAASAVKQVMTHLDDLKAQRAAEQARGESRPDPEEIAALTTESERLDKVWNLTKANLAEIQTALADLRSTNGPPTADTDPQLNRLRRQSSDLDQQISELQLIADTGHSTLDQDNQLQDLKAQSDDLAASIKDRLAESAADAKLSPQQLQTSRDHQIQSLSEKLTDLQNSESTAAAAAKSAHDKLTDMNNRLAQARAASTDDLISQITAAWADLKSKQDDATEKDRLLGQCISPGGDPQVNVQALTDQRPLFAGGASVVILVIFSFMIISASRSAAIPIADRPAPHPQPHPNVGNDDADEPSPASL
jgi:hypothetical protein